MKKSRLAIFLAAVLAAASLLSGCGGQDQPDSQDPDSGSTALSDSAKSEPTVEPDSALSEQTSDTQTENQDDVVMRIGALKGPTSIGLVQMLHENDTDHYSFTMETQADVLIASVAEGSLDIALIPANVASVLYNKTSGGVSVIDINTLGVLYMVSGDQGISSMKDLAGKTVYTTGAGSTPEYVLSYLLEANGLSDKVNVEYKSEASEVAALLAADPKTVGMLPQPFVTAALAQNEALSIVLDMTGEWDALKNGSSLVTGVTIVRNAFLSGHPQAVARFLDDHAQSVTFVNSDTGTAAEYVAEAGIIEKAAVAQKAIPYCNIVCITGTEMKDALSGYLKVLYDKDAKSVGGTLPGDDFYYTR